MTTIDNTHKSKHNPGAGFAFPSHAGTTQHPGLTIRAELSTRIFCAVSKYIHDDQELGKVVAFSLKSADLLIDALYPAPIKIAVGAPQAERGVCEHLEVVFNSQNGTFQCLKCRQGVEPSVIQARTKKK